MYITDASSVSSSKAFKSKNVFSEITGESKGYGCVEFTSKESSIKAKNQLNGHKIDNNTLQVQLFILCFNYYKLLTIKNENNKQETFTIKKTLQFENN